MTNTQTPTVNIQVLMHLDAEFRTYAIQELSMPSRIKVCPTPENCTCTPAEFSR